MEFLTGLMQQILDKFTSGQPSQNAPSQRLEDSSTKGENGTVHVDKGKRVMEAGSNSSSGGATISRF